MNLQSLFEDTIGVLKNGWQTLVPTSAAIWAVFGLLICVVYKINLIIESSSDLIQSLFAALVGYCLITAAMIFSGGVTLNAVRGLRSSSWSGSAGDVLQTGKSHIAGLGVFSLLVGLAVAAVPFLLTWLGDGGSSDDLFYIILGVTLALLAFGPSLVVDEGQSPIDAAKASFEKAKGALAPAAVLGAITVVWFLLVNNIIVEEIIDDIISPSGEMGFYLMFVVNMAVLGALVGPVYSALLVGVTEDSDSNSGGGDSAPAEVTPPAAPAAPQAPADPSSPVDSE